MAAARAPLVFWSFCLRMMIFSLARSPDPVLGGDTPYYRRHGVESTSVLVPFGCKCVYYDPNVPKFEARGLPGVVLQYAQLGAFVVLDWYI